MWTTFGTLAKGERFYFAGHVAVKLTSGGINTPGRFMWDGESDHDGWQIYNGTRVQTCTCPREIVEPAEEVRS
ncbi:hypothetical protein [Leptolyngbya sp. FACHB-261]|uniref:hypothetical protein n=1 Tax=Leptolyngbya sp. FACHB-261 TaxID=2692806 RepID=UPI001683BBCB|nr:hypothetical protein [Leptolyngbya sp. FACHB-261]MBD2102397.1 hypothetical protein [Leptolyngbya sp. FACHB-261]